MKWRPIFWNSQRKSVGWLLPTTILAALFLHGMAFYMIQSSAPTAKNQAAPHSRLSTLDPSRPADFAFLRWIENHDPATIARNDSSPQPPDALFATHYKPSYEDDLPEPLAIIPREREGPLETLFPPGPVPESGLNEKNKPAPIDPPASAFLTSATITIEKPARFQPPTISEKLPLPSRFLVVASEVSDQRFYFLMDSSGIEKLDDYGKSWLMDSKITFPEESKTGWVSIYWGQEIWKGARP